MAENPDLPLLDMVESNIIRNNRIRCDHGWDIDLDDGSSNYIIYNNLLLNGGIKLREGYRRTVTNNIVVNNGLHPHVWPKNNGDVFKNNIVFTAHQPSSMTRGLKPDDKWGEEIDYNIYASSNSDRLKFAVNGCDFNSVVADPLFIDPGKGDFRVAEESEAIKLGFRNFAMSDFGVVSPALRSIAKTPELPEISIHPDLIRTEEAGEDVVVWLGARLHEPEGEAMSGYGLNFDSKGVALALVPEQSEAWEKGLRTGDFITRINDVPIHGIAD